jgi:pimeloyl-ACP methyl ester carboxylesterase
MHYQSHHTIDESGARYAGIDGSSPADYAGHDLGAAVAAAAARTAAGQCGYVRRTDDQGNVATLMPDGTWEPLNMLDMLYRRGPDGEYLPNP